MDPITNALVSALSAGLTKVGSTAVVDAYHELKVFIKKN